MYNLQSLRSLKSLELHVWGSGAHVTGDLFTYEGQWCLCSVAPILSQLTPTLHHLRITFSISGYPTPLRSHLEIVHWAELLRQLERFSQLQHIVLEVRPRKASRVLPDALYTVADFVERKLGTLVASGLLEVEVVELENGPTRRGDR
jgi:hypothetical protein